MWDITAGLLYVSEGIFLWSVILVLCCTPPGFNVWTHPSLHVFVYVPVTESTCFNTVFHHFKTLCCNFILTGCLPCQEIDKGLFFMHYMLQRVGKSAIGGDQWCCLFRIWVHLSEGLANMSFFGFRQSSDTHRHTEAETLFWQKLAERFL